MPDIDRFADSWRWWAAFGGALGLWSLGPWVWLAVQAAWQRIKTGERGWEQVVTTHKRAPQEWPPREVGRAIMALAHLLFLLGILIAGFLIPWATDGRLEWLTRDSLFYRSGIATAWLLWGTSGWLTALAFARHYLRLALASVVIWSACFVAVEKTMGLAL